MHRAAGDAPTVGGTPRVAVAGWIGAGNLGDELLYHVVRSELEAVGLAPVALSLDPAGTIADHGTLAVGHTRIWGALGRTDALVFGGGGLVQDETSAWSPLYQLSRPGVASARGRPVVALGLGAGPLRGAVARRAARAALGRALRVVARDRASRSVLEGLGLRHVELGADLAFLLDPPRVTPGDGLVVSLRPKPPRGGLVPGSWRQRQPDQDAFVAAVAAQLDDLVGPGDAPVTFLAMEPSRDAPLHAAIADRMRASAELVSPELPQLFEIVGRARTVIASRFHAGVAAVLQRRPTVLLGYAPKVVSLADELGAGVRLLDHSVAGVADLAATARPLSTGDHVPDEQGLEALRVRAQRNRGAIEDLATLLLRGGAAR